MALKNKSFCICLLVIFCFLLVSCTAKKDAREETLITVIQTLFSGPDEDLVSAAESAVTKTIGSDIAGDNSSDFKETDEYNHILQDKFSDYVTEEVMDEIKQSLIFIQITAGQNQNKISAGDIIVDSKDDYSFQFRLNVEGRDEITSYRITGTAQFKEDQISSFTILDWDGFTGFH